MKKLLIMALSLVIMNAVGHLVTITSEDQFNREILQSNKPAVVKVGATWCPACTRSEGPFEKLSEDASYGNVVFATMDADKNDALASKYSVQSLPTFLYFNNGKKVAQEVGFNKSAVENNIKKLTASAGSPAEKKNQEESVTATPNQENTTAAAQEVDQANAGCPAQGVGASFLERAYYSFRDFCISVGQTVRSWFK